MEIIKSGMKMSEATNFGIRNSNCKYTVRFPQDSQWVVEMLNDIMKKNDVKRLGKKW